MRLMMVSIVAILTVVTVVLKVVDAKVRIVIEAQVLGLAQLILGA